VFSTLDLVDLAKNRKNFSGALFRHIWGQKLKRSKNFLSYKNLPLTIFGYFLYDMKRNVI